MSLSLLGSLIGLVAILTLTLLVRRLWKSEEKLRLITENSSDLVCLHAPSGEYLWVSPSVLRILGYTPKEMVGKNPYTFFHPDDILRIQEAGHKPSLRGVADARVTYRMKRKDGSYVWLESLTSPVMDAKGKEVVKLITSSRDVSATQEAENLYRFLVRNLPGTSVFLFDADLHFIVAEGSLPSRTMQPSGSLEGQSLWRVFPADIAQILAPYFKEALRGLPLRTEETFRSRTYEAHFLPVHNANGGVRAGLAVFQDVTEKRSRVQELVERSYALERSNQDLEQFANVASHELKSPLRRISSFADLLCEDFGRDLPPEASEYLGHISEGVDSLQEVIDSLLVYSRAQRDRMKMESVDVNEVFNQAILNLATLIREKKAVVQKGVLPDKLAADPVLLRQIFENLVGNAIKFNTTGRTPRVLVEARRDLLDWEFSVSDNGPGLSNVYQDKVFMMFQRLNPNVEGTGIGLALCKKIIEIHRGKIWFESVPGEGAVFKFIIPARSFEEITLQ